MDNSLHFEQTPYHHVCLKDRKSLELTGVKKIESFDAYEFLIETSLGYLNITGSELTLVRLDQDQNQRDLPHPGRLGLRLGCCRPGSDRARSLYQCWSR